MADKDLTEKELAAEMARFLFVNTKRDYYGNKETSPIEAAIQRLLNEMAQGIAAEMVAANAEIRALITTKVRETIARALADDGNLNAIVTKSVAEALTRHYADEPE